MAKLFIEDLKDLKNRRVIVRVDFNVPLKDGKVDNDIRLKAALPTINFLVESGAKVILMSHLGRPKGEKKPEFSLSPVAAHLNGLLGKDIKFVNDCIGKDVELAVETLGSGEVLLLENLRYYNQETNNDEEFSKKLASLAEIYVNDAFGTAHRAHASTEGVTKFIDKCACGYLLKKELDFLGDSLETPKRPFVAIIGGAKISGKIDVIEALLPKVDKLIIGGGMGYTFAKSQGLEIGTSLLESDKVELAKTLIEKGEGKIELPTDVLITDKMDFAARTTGELSVSNIKEIPSNKMGLDIGPETTAHFSKIVEEAGTVVWNGPMGVFEIEATSKGTFAVANALVKSTQNGGITIVGGGDSASAISKAGLANKVSHVSTGGGASLEFLEGKKLPGVEALSDVQ